MIEFINTPDGMCPLCHNAQATVLKLRRSAYLN